MSGNHSTVTVRPAELANSHSYKDIKRLPPKGNVCIAAPWICDLIKKNIYIEITNQKNYFN